MSEQVMPTCAQEGTRQRMLGLESSELGPGPRSSPVALGDPFCSLGLHFSLTNYTNVHQILAS